MSLSDYLAKMEGQRMFYVYLWEPRVRTKIQTTNEIDILKEKINVLKKVPHIDQTVLSNREKAVIIVALKTNYSLPRENLVLEDWVC